MTDVGKRRFKELIDATGTKAYILSKNMHYGQSAIYQWITGYRLPTLHAIVALSKVLNCSIEELVLIFTEEI